jgi:hypothetical protein
MRKEKKREREMFACKCGLCILGLLPPKMVSSPMYAKANIKIDHIVYNPPSLPLPFLK